MGAMKDFDVSGRGMGKATVSVQAGETGITLMIDDEARPEFWLHIRISRDKLAALLASADARAAAEGSYFNNGRRIPPPAVAAVELPDVPGPTDHLPEIPPGWVG